jgi:hypothetical protein
LSNYSLVSKKKNINKKLFLNLLQDKCLLLILDRIGLPRPMVISKKLFKINRTSQGQGAKHANRSKLMGLMILMRNYWMMRTHLTIKILYWRIKKIKLTSLIYSSKQTHSQLTKQGLLNLVLVPLANDKQYTCLILSKFNIYFINKSND